MKLCFTFRDVIWLSIILALVIVGFVDRRQMSDEMERLKAELKQLKADLSAGAHSGEFRVFKKEPNN